MRSTRPEKLAPPIAPWVAHFRTVRNERLPPSDEYGILWNDPALAIDWGAFSPVLSEKDANNRKLADVQQQFLPQYSPK